MYRKEAEEMKRKLDKLIADGNSPDEWDVKNAVSERWSSYCAANI